MTMTAALASGRRAAERLMDDRATIVRPSGPPGAPDPVTGVVTTPTTPLVTAYPCRLRSFEPFEAKAEVGAQQVTTQRTALRLPVSVTYIPEPGDIVTITVSRHDPSIVGRIFRVANKPTNSLSTAFRVYVDEVTS